MQKKKQAPKKAKAKAGKKPASKKSIAETSSAASTSNSVEAPQSTEASAEEANTRPVKKGRDNSVYIYAGAEYKKGRLVHKIISDHVAKAKGKMTYEQLRTAFPESIQKRFTVFKKESETHAFNSSGRERFLSKPEELIKVKNATIAVTNQWTAQSLAPFLKMAASLGYKVKVK